jgi:hypothetical protein
VQLYVVDGLSQPQSLCGLEWADEQSQQQSLSVGAKWQYVHVYLVEQ